MSALSRVSPETLRSAEAGSVVYPPGGKFGPRIQPDIQLVLLYTGEMRVAVDGRELRVPPGHVALLKPGHEEMFAFSRTEETWHRWISVRIDPLSRELRDDLYRLPAFLPVSEPMNRLVDLMLALQKQAVPAEQAMHSLGLAALQLYPVETQKALLMQEKHPALYKSQSWIREHCADDLSLKDIAGHAGVSPEHLVRIYRRYEQITPVQYLWRIRIRRATELLTSTGLTVTEIAHLSGFKTSHHLARLIKQSTGKTASEIRRSAWGSFMTR